MNQPIIRQEIIWHLKGVMTGEQLIWKMQPEYGQPENARKRGGWIHGMNHHLHRLTLDGTIGSLLVEGTRYYHKR